MISNTPRNYLGNKSGNTLGTSRGGRGGLRGAKSSINYMNSDKPIRERPRMITI